MEERRSSLRSSNASEIEDGAGVTMIGASVGGEGDEGGELVAAERDAIKCKSKT